MGPRTIDEIPFDERPLRELLHLEVDRDLPSRNYAGVGWARAPSLWIESTNVQPRRKSVVRDILVLALHSSDDGEVLPHDIELEFDNSDQPVTVLASAFLARWLPRLPRSSGIVLALCNRHNALLRAPAGIVVPLHYGFGDVASWREVATDGSERIILTAETWSSYLSATIRSEPTFRFIS